jgi:hypothetical protein
MATPHPSGPTGDVLRHPDDLRPAQRQSGRWFRVVLGSVLLMLATSACFTGERPTFGCGVGESTGRTEVDEVLNRLECVAPSVFTAEYTVLTRLGDITSQAEVVQAPGGRRSITINDVRYLYDSGRTATCNVVSDTCEAIINEARTSDVFLSSEFYAKSMASRLRVDADRRIGDPVASEQTLGDQPALCVAIPVTGGTKTYCALESGAIALFDANDLLIQLTSYSPTPDEAAFDS